MSDTPRDFAHTQHPDSDPPPAGPFSKDAVEHFAIALDAIVLGTPVPETDDRPLALLTTTAGEIQRRGGTWQTVNGPQSATPIDAATKHRIWEDLMAQNGPVPVPGIAQSHHQTVIGRLRAVMQPWVAIDDEKPEQVRPARTRRLHVVPDVQPLATLALIIAVLIGIGAGFSGIVDPGDPMVTPTASAEGVAGLTGQASPADAQAAVPTADPADEFQRPISIGAGACTVEPRPVEDVAAILRNPGPVTPRAYLPATTPDPAVAEEVARFGRTYLACEYAGPVNSDRALQTPRYIHEDPANAYFREAGGASDIATPDERKQLASLALGEDYRANLFLVRDLAISREELEALRRLRHRMFHQAPQLRRQPTFFRPDRLDLPS